MDSDVRLTPFGPIPAHWDVAEVRAVGLVQGGKARSPATDSGPNMLPYLRVANVLDGRIDYRDVNMMHFSRFEEEKYMLRVGDVLLNEGQSTELVGRSAIYDGPDYSYCFQNSLVNFRASPRVDPFFARAIFKRWLDTGHFLKIVKQTTSMAHLGASRFAALLFPVPPRDEQRAISAVLGAADEAIGRSEQIIAKLVQVKQGLLHDLLTRGIDDNGELRDPLRRPDMFKATQVGALPREWQIRTVREVATKVSDGDHHTPVRAPQGVFLLSARNIRDGYIDLQSVDYVPEFEYLRMVKRCWPQAGDLLVSCSGSIGRVCVVPDGLRCVLVRSAALVKPDRTLISSGFFCAVMQSDLVQSQIRAAMRQAVQSNLFQNEIAGLRVVLPPLHEQQASEAIINNLQARIQAEKIALAKLRLLKQALTEDLLTGRVRVTPLLHSSP